MKIVTGAEASQFKCMRFRNYILQVFLHKRQRKEGKAKETTKAKPTKDIKKPSKDERGRRQLCTTKPIANSFCMPVKFHAASQVTQYRIYHNYNFRAILFYGKNSLFKILRDMIDFCAFNTNI